MAPTPAKKVRFQLDETEKLESTMAGTSSTEAVPIRRKFVRFAHEYPESPHLETLSTSSTTVEPLSSLRTLLEDTKTTSKNPLIIPTPSGSTTPLPPKYPTRPSLALDTTNPTTPDPSSPPSTSNHHPDFDLSPTGVPVLQYDAGEKDASGNVMDPVPNESCEKCGGKIVWATKGEYFLICQDCQEPQ
jgi:hypothetical protein